MSPISRSIFLTLCPYSSRNEVRSDMSPSTGTVFSVPISHMAHGASVTGTCIHELDTLWAPPEPSQSWLYSSQCCSPSQTLNSLRAPLPVPSTGSNSEQVVTACPVNKWMIILTNMTNQTSVFTTSRFFLFILVRNIVCLWFKKIFHFLA